MTFKKYKKSGFTLVEMLIVIVIIGILAAALIPRLGAVRGKARDAGRKAAVSQAATAMQIYGMDFGVYLAHTTGASFDYISGTLTAWGMDIIPTDKNPWTAAANCNINSLAGNWGTGYGYISIKKTTTTSDANKAFVMRTCPESAGSANRVWCGGTTGAGAITGGTVITNIYECSSLSKGTPCTNASTSSTNPCIYSDDNQARYIFEYPSSD